MTSQHLRMIDDVTALENDDVTGLENDDVTALENDDVTALGRREHSQALGPVRGPKSIGGPAKRKYTSKAYIYVFIYLFIGRWCIGAIVHLGVWNLCI